MNDPTQPSDALRALARAYLDRGAEDLGGLLREHPLAAERLLDALLETSLEIPAEPSMSDHAEPDPAHDHAARRIGRYVLLEQLGEGGQGKVFLAQDTTLSRFVALKLLGHDHTGAEIERFRREAETASRLAHPDLCTVYDYGEEDGVLFIAMEFVAGRSLAAHLQATEPQSDQFPAHDAAGLRRVLEFFERVASAIHTAHHAGIIHRDLKPGNLMVREDGNPVVVDFGLAREDRGDRLGLTRSGDVLGTPRYMAPEQIRGERSDHRTDIYALGVTLFEALTGEVAFAAPTTAGLEWKILHRGLPSVSRHRSGWPSEIDVVVRTAAEVDRDRRYATAADLAADLRCLLERRPIAAQPASTWLRVRRFSQRNPGLVRAVALLLLAASVAGYFYWRMTVSDLEAQRRRDQASAVELRQQARELWPAWPSRIAAFEDWLMRTDALLARQPRYEEFRQRVLPRVIPEAGRPGDQRLDALLEALPTRPQVSAKEVEELERISQERFETMVWEDEDSRLEWEELDRLIGDLETLQQLREGVRRRIERAAPLAKESIDKYRERWAEVAASIRRDPRMLGLELRPQMGLIPLGANPKGLHEFAVWGSGEIPERSSGVLTVTDRAAMVMVLLPPCPKASSGTALDAFFLSKFELTRGQARELVPWFKSAFVDGLNVRRLGGKSNRLTVTPRSPLDNVDYFTAVRIGKEWGLTVPTSAQWEYAAQKAEDDSRTLLQILEKTANVCDQSAARLGSRQKAEAWDDGFPFHAPVGSFAPNRFGIYDMLGNQWEWVLDRSRVPFGPSRAMPGTGEMLPFPGEPQTAAIRGGSYAFGATSARVERVLGQGPELKSDNHGVRLARPVL